MWMAISGATGFAFFLIANFTSFQNYTVLAGFLQLPVNLFVFLAWREGYKKTVGFKKLFAFCGVVGPAITASITIWRVLIPWVFG